jgi:hypothetical protein
MLFRYRSWMLALCAGLLPAHSLALDLRLTCVGIATKSDTETSVASVRNNRGEFANVTSSRDVEKQFETEYSFEIGDGIARVRTPRSMTPLINSGSENGWRPIIGLSISDYEISGKYSLNFLNKPEFQINRTSGHISMKGLGSTFFGTCAAASVAERKF